MDSPTIQAGIGDPKGTVMPDITTSPVTDAHDGDLVVFLIGMRVNSWLAVRSWWPVTQAMPRMLKELSKEKERGLIGYRLAITAGGPFVVQYWESVEKLLAYAHDNDAQHRPAWKAYNAAARAAGGKVGIWHETYHVPAGGHESIYVNMPLSGLAAAAGSKPIGSGNRGAKERFAGAQPGATA
jgi:fumigallin biosynthesis monooxygenase-like protein